MGDSLSGLSGLALAFAFASLIKAASFALPPLFMWAWLRRFKYPNAFYISGSAGASIVAAVSVIQTGDFGIPVMAQVTLTMVICAISYLLAYAIFANGNRKKTKILVQIFLLMTIYKGASILAFENDRLEDKTYALKRGFDVYSVPGDKHLDTEQLDSRPGDLTVPFVESRIDTPKGYIIIKEAAEDDFIKTALMFPKKCDHNSLDSYIAVFGKNNANVINNIVDCDVVYQSEGRTVYVPIDTEGVRSAVPYIATINNTIIVFKAYHSGASEFKGTVGEALPYIIEFIKNARIISNEELRL